MPLQRLPTRCRWFCSRIPLAPTLFNYEPRCFSRDLNQYIATNFLTQENLDKHLATTTIREFQDVLDNNSGVGLPGLHIAGHFSFGPVGADIFSSPAEPAVYLHHAMVDRVWSQWQSLDLPERAYGENAVYGTITSLNIPPSANATLDTVINWGPLGLPRALRELMAIGCGTMCFQYD